MSVLLGTAATAGLDASALGLTFCHISAGPYGVGDAAYENNLPRSVELDSFELADTPTTNQQLRRALEQLGDRRTVLMFESVPDQRWAVVIRGREEEVSASLGSDSVREILSSLRLSGSLPTQRTPL